MSAPQVNPKSSSSDSPIGIFDSGVGGLTVARSIIDQLPGESILYVGDTARGPYGPRPLAEVRTFALEILDDLVEAGVKALVIACNTASAAMLRDARERYSVPVIEVIQPAVRRAVSATRSGKRDFDAKSRMGFLVSVWQSGKYFGTLPNYWTRNLGRLT